MELGNMLMGNSRGLVPIDREGGFETALNWLFLTMGISSYGEDYENDVFWVFPYYWGECTCGYEEKANAWSENNEHLESCYQKLVEEALIGEGFVRDKLGLLTKEGVSYTRREKIVRKIRERYCREMHLPFPDGCAVHCTCTHKKRWEKFCMENDHTPDCPVVRDNFHYKPTNFGIQWYKYPLRDAYMNQDISVKEFVAIIKHCVDQFEKEGK